MKILHSGHRFSNYQMIILAIVLAAASMMAMYSATAAESPRLTIRHFFWLAVGIMVFFAVARMNYRHWTDMAALAYGISIGALSLVLMAGAMRLGATRWLSIFGLSIQPSEFAKITAVLLLAHYLSGQPAPLSIRSILISACIVGLPAFLIFIQPDLGSSTILLAIWMGMIWVAGAPRWVLTAMAMAGISLMPIGWFLLKDYQRDRVLVFIDPHVDPLGAGFSIIQSTIAIGSGGLFGRGWRAGTQNQLNFLPEHHSDFIFSVIGEEWGFLGCAAVIGAFVFLLLHILRIARQSLEPQGRLIAAGVFSWIAYQAFVNMGMVMGLMPVVGVPLPMVSYGGSSMVMIWTALGLVQSVQRSVH